MKKSFFANKKPEIIAVVSHIENISGYGFKWWRVLVSNQRPLARQANALPTELTLQLNILYNTLKIIQVYYIKSLLSNYCKL